MKWEVTFAKLFDLNPFLYPKLEYSKNSKKYRIFVFGKSFTSEIFLSVLYNQRERLENFFHYLLGLGAIIFYATNQWILFSSQENAGYLREFPNLNTNHDDEIPDPKTHFIFVIGAMMFNAATMIQYFVHTKSMLVLFIGIPYSISYRMAFLKIVANQRIKDVVKEANKSENPLDKFLLARKVISSTQKVNRFHSLRALTDFVAGLPLFLMCVETLWEVYGTKKEMDVYESHYPFLILICHSYALHMLIIQSYPSAVFNEEIETLMFEIDRKICLSDCGLEYRKQLGVFALELRCSPVNLTGLDFFVLDNSFITEVFDLIIKAMMVFVQFIK